MKGSKLLTVVVAAALMFSNIACACATDEPASDVTEHHHMATGHDAAADQPSCPHQDCDGCDALLERCANPEYSLLSTDREGRIAPLHKVDLDNPDPDLAFVDTGQDWSPPPNSTALKLLTASRLWRADTPIHRKDQLTE